MRLHPVCSAPHRSSSNNISKGKAAMRVVGLYRERMLFVVVTVYSLLNCFSQHKKSHRAKLYPTQESRSPVLVTNLTLEIATIIIWWWGYLKGGEPACVFGVVVVSYPTRCTHAHLHLHTQLSVPSLESPPPLRWLPPPPTRRACYCCR